MYGVNASKTMKHFSTVVTEAIKIRDKEHVLEILKLYFLAAGSSQISLGKVIKITTEKRIVRI